MDPATLVNCEHANFHRHADAHTHIHTRRHTVPAVLGIKREVPGCEDVKQIPGSGELPYQHEGYSASHAPLLLL